jgi:hypothetical protein
MLMKLIRRLLNALRRPPARYADDVLFAGWVELPEPLRPSPRR